MKPDLAIQDTVSGEGGGGKGGGGGSQRTPREAPNTLRSKSVAGIIDLLSEGEIVGLAEGSESIYFDGIPFREANEGSFNFQGVEWTQRLGLPDQDPVPGGVVASNEVPFNRPLDEFPAIFSVTNPNVDSVNVKLRVPALFKTNTSNGDVEFNEVPFRIERRRDGGTWQTIINGRIGPGKTVGPYEVSYYIPLGRDMGDWDVRVSRRNQASDSATEQDSLFVSSYTEVIEGRFTYGNSAYVALVADAEQFGGNIPRRAYDVMGRIIQVPVNYDPETRAYNGIWDGTFKQAWTDNPAWIYYDMVTHPRYGLGDFLRPEHVDKFSLYTIARYCDELVPDGYGGMEPRFRFNGVINTRQEAFRVLNAITSAFRGMTYSALGSVVAIQDAPSDPTRLYTQANVIDGQFAYEGQALSARHSVINVTWNNPEDQYLPEVETVEDVDLLRLLGRKTLDTVAYGCTSRGQAMRMAKWILDTEEHETETVNFRVALSEADLLPGEIVNVADAARAGLRTSGRLAGAVEGTDTDFLLDAPHTFRAGDQLLLITANPDTSSDQEQLLETIPIVSNLAEPTGENGVRCARAPTGGVDPNAVFCIVSMDIEPTQWRVLGIEEDADNTLRVTALRHDPTKYARVEQGITLEAPQTSILPTGPLLPPSDFTVREQLIRKNNKVVTRVDLSWLPSADPRVTHYRLRVKPPGDNWRHHSSSSAVVAEIEDALDGDWEFAVAARSGSPEAGRESAALTLEYEVLGKHVPPGNVLNLTAVPGLDTHELHWDAVTDLDLVGYDVRRGDSWDTGEIVAELHVSTNILIHVETPDPVTYHVRARDEVGLLSPEISTVTARLAVPGAILNFSAYQDREHVHFSWDRLPLIGVLYEIRQGNVSWPNATHIGTATTNEISIDVFVTADGPQTFQIRGVTPLGAQGPITTFTLYMYELLTGTFTIPYHPSWNAGSRTPNLRVEGSSLTFQPSAVADAMSPIVGTFTSDIIESGTQGVPELYSVWLATRLVDLALDPTLIADAGFEIADADFPITPGDESSAPLSARLQILDEDRTTLLDEFDLPLATARTVRFAYARLILQFVYTPGSNSRPGLAEASLNGESL